MMTLTRIALLTANALVLTLAAATGCDRQEPQTSVTHTTSGSQDLDPSIVTAPEAPPGVVPASTTAPALTSSDKDFIANALQAGMLEVALGNEIAQKSVAPDVKSFGDRMVKDDTTADDELSDIAMRKGLTVPDALDPSNQSKLDELAKLDGAKLDRKYAHEMVSDHEGNVADFRRATEDLQDPDLRAWAARRLPILEDHLAAAKALEAHAKKTAK
jgi:putative membrane protein